MKNDSSVVSVTASHTHYTLTNAASGDEQYGISVPWLGSFGGWLRPVSLSYNANGSTGGTTPASVTKQYGITEIVSNAAGYTQAQAGWNTQNDDAGTSYACGSTFTFQANTTLFAVQFISPAVITQPSNKTALIGKTATFSTVVSGTAPLSYRWQINRGSGWSDISGANEASYTTASVALLNEGYQYCVVVSNAAGSITSDPVTLHVVESAAIPATGDTAQPCLWFCAGLCAFTGLTAITLLFWIKRARRA